MIDHAVRAHPSKDELPREEQLAWKMAKVVVRMENGTIIEDEQGIANAHPFGSRPFARDDYIGKFLTLTESILDKTESDRFLDLVQRLPDLDANEVLALNPVAPQGYLDENGLKGIF